MNKKETNSRRAFLKKTSVATLSLGLLPIVNLDSKENNQDVTCDSTTLDYYGQGPFYTADAPDISSNQLANENEAGTRLILSGQIKTLDCTEVIPNVLIDIWHANDAGAYDNNGFTLRGKTISNNQGFYLFETILPGKYLNGNQYRPSHIHFKITPPDHPTLTTQLYFEGDTDIPQDAAASIVSGTYDASNRIIPITLNKDGKYEGTWDIILSGDGVTGLSESHLSKGMIYSVGPNPFIDTLVINYGVFENSKIQVSVFDLNGNEVVNFNENFKNKGKHAINWTPNKDLANGYYFVSLKMNDMQVHYLKVLKSKK